MFDLVDDGWVRFGRVFEDGSYEGSEDGRECVEECSKVDPVTGKVATRGMPLLRAIASRFDNGYVACSYGSEETVVPDADRPMPQRSTASTTPTTRASCGRYGSWERRPANLLAALRSKANVAAARDTPVPRASWALDATIPLATASAHSGCTDVCRRTRLSRIWRVVMLGSWNLRGVSEEALSHRIGEPDLWLRA